MAAHGANPSSPHGGGSAGTLAPAHDKVVLTPQRWSELSALLDQLLDQPEQARAGWLDELAGRDSQQAAELRRLLAQASDCSLSEAIEQTAMAAFGPPAPDEGLVGTTWGAYRIESLIGQGGMGSVWLAQRADGRYEGRVALKILNAALLGPRAVARLQREGTLLAQLNHPHIARLLDAGVAPGGVPYLVLEHVEGTSIDKYCALHRLEVRERIALFLDVIAAVSHAHAHLIVHRDIKPSNVMVSQEGCVKLLDFGIAQLQLQGDDPAEAEQGPRTLSRAMTPQYAAPEQLAGRSTTVHTDVYSLGVVLYLLLTGRHPSGLERTAGAAEFIHVTAQSDAVRASKARLEEQIAAERNTTADRLAQRLSGDLDVILAKALKREPGQRYDSAAAFADDLRRFLTHQPILARADSMAYRSAKFLRRNRLAVAAVAVVVGSIAAGVAATAMQARVADQQALLAREQAQRAEAVQGFLLEIFAANRRTRGDPTQARLTTARELIDLGAGRIETAFAASPRAKVEITAALAKMYEDLGLEKEALGLWLNAAQTARRNPADIAAGKLVEALVGVARASPRATVDAQRDAALDEAQRLLAQPGAVDAQQSGALLLQLAWRRHTQSRFSQAAELAAHAAAQFKAAHDEGGHLRATQAQAAALHSDGRLDEAVTVVRGVLAAAGEAPTQALRELASLESMLGAILLGQRRRVEAESVLRKSLALSIQANGSNHRATALAHLQLAQALNDLGRGAEAVAQGQLAVQVIEQYAGAQDTDILPYAQLTLGVWEEAYGDVDVAAAHVRRATQMQAQADPTSDKTAAMVADLAQCLAEAGQLDEAEQTLLRAEQIAQPYPQVARLRIYLAKAWLALRLSQGTPDQIRPALERMLQAYVPPLPEQSIDAFELLESALLAAEAAQTIADPRAEQLLAMARRKLAQLDTPSVSPLETARLAMLDGADALGRGAPDKAAVHFREAVRLRVKALHPDSLQLAHARVWQARAVLAAGQPDEARALLGLAKRAHAARAGVGPLYRRTLAQAETELHAWPRAADQTARGSGGYVSALRH